jgi:exodeoxyribonuclease VII large subunit
MDHGKRLLAATTRSLQSRNEILTGLARGLLHPRGMLDQAMQRMDDWSERLIASLPSLLTHKNQKLAVASAKLQPISLMRNLTRHAEDIDKTYARLGRLTARAIDDRAAKLIAAVQLLESLGPTSVMARGFALVRAADGTLLTRAASVPSGETLSLVFHDGTKTARSD